MKIWTRFKAKVKRAWGQFKTWFYGILISLGLVASPFLLADADDVNLSWNNATEWTDGTPMSIDDLDVTVIRRRSVPLSDDPAAAPKLYVEIGRVTPANEAYTDANLPNAIYCYVVFYIAKNGIPGEYSDETCKTIDVRKPGKATGLSAT